MTAGIQPTLTGFNNQAGSLATTLRNTLEQIATFKAWLDATGSAGLQTLGMTSADAATLISAYNDLNDLNTIYNGGASIHLTGSYNYSTFAKQLTAYT